MFEELYFEKSNQGRTFTMNSRALGCVVEQMDVGMQVHSSFKTASQMDRVFFSTLSFSIECGCHVTGVQDVVRLHLEYCVQLWALCYRKDVVRLERLQSQFQDVVRTRAIGAGWVL